MNVQHADDLDDGFVLVDIVAESEGEEIEFASNSSAGDEEDSPTASASVAMPQASSDGRLKAKKRKRREKEKEKKEKKRRLVQALDSTNEPLSIAAQAPSLQAEYLAKLQAKAFPKLSSVELDDVRIPENIIVDTTAWMAPRTLDQLPDFIAKMVPTLKTWLARKSKDNGAPTLFFIAGGALRVADATRVLKSKTLRGEKGGDVAKLFARHIKLEEHVAYLRRAKIGVAVGTPGRIGKLLCETDALSTSALTHIILDVSYKDVKKRSLVDIPETRDEVFRTVLGTDSIRQAVQRGKIQIVLF